MQREPKTTLESTWSPLNDRIVSEQDMNDYKNQNSQFLDGPKKNKRLQVFEEVELNMFKDVIYEEPKTCISHMYKRVLFSDFLFH